MIKVVESTVTVDGSKNAPNAPNIGTYHAVHEYAELYAHINVERVCQLRCQQAQKSMVMF